MTKLTDEVTAEVMAYAEANYGSGLVAIEHDATIREVPAGYWVSVGVFVPRKLLDLPDRESHPVGANCDSCGRRYAIDPYVCEKQMLWEITNEWMLSDLPLGDLVCVEHGDVVCRDCIIIGVKHAAEHELIEFTKLSCIIDEMYENNIVLASQMDELRAAICTAFVHRWGLRSAAREEEESG